MRRLLGSMKLNRPLQMQMRSAKMLTFGQGGAAHRSRTAESQDESPCRAIHKQRPYRGLRMEVAPEIRLV
jgi:hypothetical protein